MPPDKQNSADPILLAGNPHAESRFKLTFNLIRAFGEAGLEYPAVLDNLARATAEATGDAVLIYLLSEDNAASPPLAVHHRLPATRQALQELHPTGRLPLHDLFAAGRLPLNSPTCLPDLPHSSLFAGLPPAHQEGLRNLPAHSLLSLPLRVQGRQIGMLVLLRTRLQPSFTPEEQEFYQDVAQSAALAIDHARLSLEAAQRARELEALRSVTGGLLSNLNLDSLLSQIIDAAIGALPSAEKGVLYLLARDTGELQIRAVQGFTDPRIRKLALQQITGYPARAVQEHQSVQVADIQRELAAQHGSGRPPEEIPIRSLIAAPLLLGDQALGVLVLNSSKIEAFTPADLRLLESFAATATTALQNAYLHGEVQKLAITDALTHLYNRRGFYELGQHEFERARRFERPLSALMLDLDGFKEVNDSYGHATGDLILQTFGSLLHASLREVDVVGRYGGDEFLILLPETDLFFATQVGERIRSAVAAYPWPSPVAAGSITISVGVTKMDAKIKDLNILIARADAALYQAKHLGRNRVEVG